MSTVSVNGLGLGGGGGVRLGFFRTLIASQVTDPMLGLPMPYLVFLLLLPSVEAGSKVLVSMFGLH